MDRAVDANVRNMVAKINADEEVAHLVHEGKIEAVGPAATVKIPAGYRVLKATVVTPGLIDAHATVGLSGLLNQPQDQDILDTVFGGSQQPTQVVLQAQPVLHGKVEAAVDRFAHVFDGQRGLAGKLLGHGECGIYAEVMAGGTVAVGDTIAAEEPELL